MTETKKKIKYLIADTTAFINTVQLNDYCENVLTVPDVIDEVRNKRQIRRLCVLPYDLQVREPRPESVKHCVEFSKKTGDYASLSGIDIKVIALTYELEADTVGTSHLRSEPVMGKIVASKEKPEEFQDNTKLPGWYNNAQASDSSEEEEEYEEEDEKYDEETDGRYAKEDQGGNEILDSVKASIEKQLENPDEKHDVPEVTQEELEELFEKLKCEADENDKTCEILVSQSQIDDDAASKSSEDCDERQDMKEDANDSTSNSQQNEDDDSAWITPSNIKKVKKSMEGRIEDDFVPEVACMSTDFAVQNTLKQMNLNIAALNGRIIKHLRTYILRCYACFKTTSIMTKVFCPNCGNKTLKRVAVSLDENGKQVIHINTRRPLTTKYKNQSIPRFRGGKHSRNPILFEDQPIPRQMPSRVAKTKTNALNEDYTAGFSPFALRDVDSKSAMLRSKGNLKEWARNNTFEEDRRRKHYNRLYK